MVNIKIEFNGQILTLPVNPEELNNSRSADNEKLNIVGLGNIVAKKEIGLTSLSIESFFPSPNNDFYTGISPKSCVNFINKMWKSSKVGRLITEGLPLNYNMYFVIDNFDYDSKAGEEEDLYYNLQITEFIPYGARLINMQGENIGIIDTANRVDTKPLIDQVYIIQKGDTILSITRKIVGDTSRWKELYLQNTALIGDNPENLYVGAKLTLPESWVVK